MFTRIMTVGALLFPLLCGSVQGQFLSNYPQSDPGVNLSFFLQADINHDGHTDVVGIRSPAANTVELTVLLGNGTGGFGAPVNTAITGIDKVQIGQFVLGDFNNDGHLDVVVFGNNHVTGVSVVAVMLGNGNGTFEAPLETSTLGSIPVPEPTVVAVVAGDFNGDGKLDLAYFGGPGVVVMPGKGDGTFSLPKTTSTLTGSLIAAGNFNNDKKLDLVGASPPAQGGTVSVLLGNGDGTFQSAIVTRIGGSWPMAVADLNGDGYTDVLLGPGFGEENGLTVLLSDGTGHFPTFHTYGGPLYPVLAVHDLNGDGRPDVALLETRSSPWTVSVLLNNGDGSFTPGRTYLGDGKPAGIGALVADLNGDGKVDLAFGNGVGGISVLPGNGNGTFKGNFVGSALSPQTTDIRVGDFNSDLKPDLFGLPTEGQILLGNGDGTFKEKGACSSNNLGTVALGDFNHDGKLDAAGNITNSLVPMIQVCLGNGDGTFTAGGQFDQGIQHKLVLPGDFNNDGKLDLAASDQNGISILLGNGDGSFQAGIPTAVNASFPSFAVADFNNDGKLDIAALTSGGVAVFLGKGNGTFEAPIVSPGPAGGYMTVTDLNKDGKRDLVVSGGGSVTVLLGKGNGTFQAPVHYALNDNASTRAVVADFNADGNPDVALGVSGDAVDVLFGNGLGKLSTPKTFRVGAYVFGIAEADFNLDKKPDLAIVLSGVVATLLHQ